MRAARGAGKPRGSPRGEAPLAERPGTGPQPEQSAYRSRAASLPQAVRCGYLRVPVQPWVPAPQQCNNCWDIGTARARACRRRTAVCGRCAEAHPTEGCREGPQCANCGQPHPAWDPGCPVKQRLRDGTRPNSGRPVTPTEPKPRPQ